jgi:hypothetical protein
MSTIFISHPGGIRRVNQQDQITSPQWTTPSDDWKMLGALEYKVVYGRSTIIKRYTMEDVRRGLVPWRYKNRTQRCYVVDMDHGTKRVWISPSGYFTTTLVN